MQIWVDADACPGVIKEILYRAAERTRVALTLVANQPLRTPRSLYIRTLQVAPGFDVADNEIVSRVERGHLVITADIPLAAAVIAKGAEVLSPRGERLDTRNIGQRLATRDLMDELRSAGLAGGGPPPLSQKERKAFADQLDRALSR